MLAIILLAVFGVAEIGDEMLVKKKKASSQQKQYLPNRVQILVSFTSPPPVCAIPGFPLGY